MRRKNDNDDDDDDGGGGDGDDNDGNVAKYGQGRAGHHKLHEPPKPNPNGCELQTYSIDVHIIQQNVNTIFFADLFYRNDHRRAF